MPVRKIVYLKQEQVCEMLSITKNRLEKYRSLKSSNPITGFNSSSNCRVPFVEPDMVIGKSPRWERDKLIKWLKINGSRLRT